MNYFQRIQRLLDFIEDHLQDKLQIGEIAVKAYFSAFPFQRMFLAVSGFTVSEYIRKRRLTEAAKLLNHSNESVLQIPGLPIPVPGSLHKGLSEQHRRNSGEVPQNR